MPGSKRERSPGKWTLTVTLGTDYRGKQRRFNKTFHGSAAEAEKALAIFYAECVAGNSMQAGQLSISQIVKDYIYSRPKNSLKKNTISNYERALANQIEPFIGSLTAQRTSARKLQDWINDISAKWSPKTVLNAKSLLSSSYERLVRMGELSENPCHRLLLPKKEHKEAEFLDEKESREFIKVVMDLSGEWLPYKLAFEIAIFCGLRSGEILGLDWQDVDLINCTLTVRQTRYPETGASPRLDTPKNVKSRRTIGFPVELKKDFIALASFYSERKILLRSEWIDSPAVIRGTWGQPLCQSMLIKKLHDLQNKHNLKKITMHQLRHTNISIMISIGLDLKTIQERGGYSNASTPLNIYGHLFRNKDPQIAGKIYDITSSK